MQYHALGFADVTHCDLIPLPAIQPKAAATAGSSHGTGQNSSASQGFTAVTSITNNTVDSDIIHSSAASGSNAAMLDSNSNSQAVTGSETNAHSSRSKTGGTASAQGKPVNAVSDSSQASSAASLNNVSIADHYCASVCMHH